MMQSLNFRQERAFFEESTAKNAKNTLKNRPEMNLQNGGFTPNYSVLA